MLYKDKKWFEKQVNQGKLIDDMVEELGVTKGTIQNWEKKHGLTLKRKERVYKSNLDAHFFDEVDTEEKAYILGFIVADGSIGKSGKSGRGRYVDIVVTNRDVDVLLKIQKAIKHTGKISNKKQNKQKRLYLTSTRLCEQLAKYGVVRGKTRNAFIPNLEDEKLYRHFLRGLFDGDGHIGERQCTLTTGSERMANDLVTFANLRLGLMPHLRTDKGGKNFFVVFNKRDGEFIKFLYEDSSIYLDRKFEAYKNYWS